MSENPLDAKALEAAKEAQAAAFADPRMIECTRCKGKGYHHGFGEDGHDPDWCNTCGGGGVEPADGEQDRPLVSAIRAYLAALPSGVGRVDPDTLRLIRAGNRLSVGAQTTGGVAGRDDGLVQAIDDWAVTVAAVEMAVAHLAASPPPVGDAAPKASGSIAFVWMNSEHLQAYQDGTSDGIAWASPKQTEFYTVPLSPITNAPPVGDAGLVERIKDILGEDAPNKDVWKSHASQDDWIRTKLLPALRDALDQVWAARISDGMGGKVSLGNYKDEIAAARAYDHAALKLHGEFATLNFPKEI